VENDIKIAKMEVKLETIEKTLERTVDILEELVKSEVHQHEIEKRITKIEGTLSRLNWIVITAVFGAVLALVINK
jgi:predicted transcriptional regulator